MACGAGAGRPVRRNYRRGLIETYGIAFAFMSSVDSLIVSEPDQPAAWFPLASPPERTNERHWKRVNDHALWLRQQRGRWPLHGQVHADKSE